MDRRFLLKTGGLTALAQISGMNTLKALESFSRSLAPSDVMPAMFVGHGNPMNAIEDTFYRRTWQGIGKALPRPQAILSISAHWLTNETKVLTVANPRTIHDFGGFPKKLFEQEYPAIGSPKLALATKELIKTTQVSTDETWGLDHGTWSVLKPMFPLADIPVFQLSIVYSKPMEYHYEIGKQISVLRNKGVLVMGSGNIVHNLMEVDWDNSGKNYEWAHDFDSKVKEWLDKGDHASLLNYQKVLGKTAEMAHPTYDHFLPLFYILGMTRKEDRLTYFNDRFDMGSISMRSFVVQG